MSALDEIEDLVRTTAGSAGPSVVSIGRRGRGTGFVVAQGRVLTNAHNLRDRTTLVRFADGRTEQGAVTGTDVDGDLVVLDVGTGQAPPLQWSTGPVRPGDVVVTVTAGQHEPRTTWGQVTSTDRGFRGPRGGAITGAIEHTAPSAQGSSGAPVLDRRGTVVGINTHRVEHGLYLARVADETLRERVLAMGEGRRYDRARLGVALAPPPVAAELRRAVGLPDRDGLLVRTVAEGSPADRAGIRQGDLLVRAADRGLRSVEDLVDALAQVAPADELEVELVRGAESVSLSVTFPATPA